MASFKTRRKHLSKGGTQIGGDGDYVTEAKFGVVSACVPAVSASGAGIAGSMAITGLNAGAKIMILPTNSSQGVVCYSACVATAGAVSASFCSATGEQIQASTLQFAYIAFV